MSLEVKQDYAYKRKDWWEWSVWIEGPEDELDGIEYVEYMLHPTFPDPARKVTDRSTQFRLKAAGWGTFTIYVNVHYKDGHDEQLRHPLELHYPDAAWDDDVAVRGAPEKAAPPPPVLYLSSGSADASFAEALKGVLTERGLDVVTTSDLPGDLPMEASLREVMHRADLYVAVISDRPSSWVIREVEFFLEHNKRPIPLLIGEQAHLPTEWSDVNAIRIDEISDPRQAAYEVADWLVKMTPDLYEQAERRVARR